MLPIQGEHIAIMPFTEYGKTPEAAATQAAQHAARWQNEHADQFVLCMVTESRAATGNGFSHTYTLTGYIFSGLIVETGMEEAEIVEQVDQLAPVSGAVGALRQALTQHGLAVC